MQDLRDHFVLDVIADLTEAGELTMERIKNALYKNLNGLVISQEEKSLVVYDNTNEMLIKRFIAVKMVEGRSKRTIQYYAYTLSFISKLVNKNYLELSTTDIQAFLASQMVKGNSISQLNNLRRVLSSFYRFLTENDILSKNPMTLIKQIRNSKNLVKPFTDEELELMRNKATVRERALIEFLFSTGCRISEVVSLNRSDIDWGTKEITVLGKGNKERIVFLNPTACMYLNKYFEQRNDDNPALFVTVDKPHDRIKVSGLEIIIRRLGRSCGVQKAHPHRFRHTVATASLKRGMPIELVQKMLGHENLDTTMIYAETSESKLKSAHEQYVW